MPVRYLSFSSNGGALPYKTSHSLVTNVDFDNINKDVQPLFIELNLDETIPLNTANKKILELNTGGVIEAIFSFRFLDDNLSPIDIKANTYSFDDKFVYLTIPDVTGQEITFDQYIQMILLVSGGR